MAPFCASLSSLFPLPPFPAAAVVSFFCGALLFVPLAAGGIGETLLAFIFFLSPLLKKTL